MACSGSSPTWTAATAAQSDVQACITAASSGDTILVPASAGVAYSALTLSSGKCLTLNGQGGVTVTSSGAIVMDASSTCEQRVTGFTFTNAGGNPPASDVIMNLGTFGMRLDHCTFNASGTAIFVAANNIGPGLIDHCTFTSGGASEMIHNLGFGAANTGGWVNTVTPGGPSMLFVENCTFNNNVTSPILSVIESYYGAQSVIRYSTINGNCQIDQHGTSGNVGTRWFEFYNNQYFSQSTNQPSMITIRGGSGVIWGNTADGTNTHGSVGMINMYCENSGTWPTEYCPGSGYNGITTPHSNCTTTNSAPIQIWGNNSNMGITSNVGGVAGLVNLNRDYFTNTSEPATINWIENSTDTCSTTYAYTPYTYPHPLIGSTVGTPTFSPTAGTYSSTQSVTISTSTGGATICYTTDGSTPTANGAGTCTHGTTYSTPVTVAASLMLQAVGSESGFSDSSVGSASYTITSGVVTFSPTTLSFGSVNTGVSSSGITTTLSNTTSGTITYAAPTITGFNRTDFYYSPSSTCNIAGSTLAAGGSCTFIMVFTPSAAPGATETVTLGLTFTGGGSSPQSVTLTGTSQSSSFLPPARTIDWTQAGIPGGIPSASWPICQTIPPSGGADDSATIQTAINSCPAGSVVVLTAGTYTLHRTSTPSPPGTVCVGKTDDFATGVYEAGLCLTDKSIVLRGAGPNLTVLNYGDGANIISMGQTYLSSSNVTFTPITSTALKGATSITVGTLPSGVIVGSYIVVSETNPTDTDGNPLINTTGYTGSCSGCGHGLTNNQLQQINHVTGITGTTMTLERPLYWNYTNSPVMFRLPMIESVGLESLRVVGTAASGTALEFKNINIEACARCWVHNVETDWAVDKSNIYLSDTYQNEISNNYLFQGFNHNSGADYSLLLEFRNSENLIANNIIRLARHSTPNAGGAGNVYIYNYMINAYMGENHNFLPETTIHSPEAYMDLWEGNVMSNTEFGDFAHGSSNTNTFFRNYINLTSNNPDTNTPMTTGIIAINTAYYSNYQNIVGNALGQWPSGCTASTYETDASTAKVNGVIWQLGYFDDGGGSTPNQALSNKVGSTLIRGGNWDCVSNSTVWNNNVPSGFSGTVSSYLAPQTMPNSLAFSTAPFYFTATSAVWPPINTASGTVVNQIPAQICYNQVGGPNSSLGGNFNPAACYATGSSSLALAPSSTSFGNVAIGFSSSSATFTLTNSGTASAIISSITFTGAAPADFTQTNNCGSGLAASSSCNIFVTFSPILSGLRNATLTITDSDASSPQTASLSGVGIQTDSFSGTSSFVFSMPSGWRITRY